MLRIKTIFEATEGGELIAVGTERVVEAVPAHLVGKVLVLGEVEPEPEAEDPKPEEAKAKK